VELAKELIADVRRFDEQLAADAAKITVLLEEHGTRLRKIDGIGPILAARLLGRTGPPNRFASAAAYANYSGTTPVQIASADSSRHPALPLRRPATELRDLHDRHDPNPHARQHRPRVLRQENRRRQSTAIRHPRTQTTPRRTPLAHHARRPNPHRTNAFGRGGKRLLTNREAPHRR
jgi:hypothetical protein